MKNCGMIITLITSIVWLSSCSPRRKRSETTETFHRTGEPIAVDNLIQEYEIQHQKFYKEEIGNGDHLEWPALNNKNLSTYCRKYLQQSVPGKTIDNCNGIKILKTLSYVKENSSITSHIDIIQCKVGQMNQQLAFYMTRAPEPECVYALKSAKNQKLILTIIHKHCGFEEKLLINRPLKRKQDRIVRTILKTTGQPIVKDVYLLKYELEHHELFKAKDICLQWPHAMTHQNLDYYCYQYMKECVPNRKREGVKGNWKIGKLHYQKLIAVEDVYVTVVACQPSTASHSHYIMTRAPESNCVYALNRSSADPHYSLEIIFKHCDFENLENPQIISHNYNILDENIVPKTEMKEENLDIFNTLHFFPKD